MVDTAYLAGTLRLVEQSMCPYKTGNLCNNGFSGVSQVILEEAHYTINATQAAPYGIILNEASIIKRKNKAYYNRHYHWHDNAVDLGVNYITSLIGGERIL